MRQGSLIVWGGIGGLVTYVLIFILPAINRLLEAEQVHRNEERRMLRKVLTYLLLLVAYFGIGAASAIYVDASNTHGAFVAGVSAETLIKGASSGAKVLTELARSAVA